MGSKRRFAYFFAAEKVGPAERPRARRRGVPSPEGVPLPPQRNLCRDKTDFSAFPLDKQKETDYINCTNTANTVNTL